MTREEKVKAVLEAYFKGFKDELIEGAVTLICAIKEEPKYVCNADGSVEPVQKTGVWIKSLSNKPYKCSACGLWSYTDWEYCPHCGARMEGVKAWGEVLYERD